MNLFYNQNGVGNVLMAQLTTDRPHEVVAESSKDVTILKDGEGEIVGFNLFNASSYLDLQEAGQVKLTEEIVEKISTALKKNDVNIELDVDLTPKFVTGYVLEKEKHPNADKLSVCKVDVGSETLQIVCGAPNIEAGQKVVVAKVGAVMPSGMIIRDAELRGVPSSGMICSAKELDLPDAPQEKGILVLPDDAVTGEAFEKVMD
ncbi:YtpR family tRNA-binding protein [Sporosarcina contaminans]|uniref:YtpR family tRNA-binding protein n=1 Tax=Sporosarcina contaminans TaxID=633403 RepID=A0ABW3U3C3_9BACL